MEPIEELDTRTCLSLLRSTDVGRLALVAERLEVFPINYAVDSGTLLFRTAEGTKLAGALHADEVVVEADGTCDDHEAAWSVVVRGSASEVTGLVQRFEAGDVPLFPWHAGPKHHVIRVTPSEITGRRFHVAADSSATDPDAS